MISRNTPLALVIVLFLGAIFQNSIVVADQLNAKSNTVLYWYRNYDAPHSRALLELALSKTEDIYGKTHVLRSQEFTQGRADALLRDLNNDLLDVASIVPSKARIEALRPIYVALEEGLVGRRICLIRKTEEQLFQGIRTISDLADKGIVVGQGEHWPDTTILRDNGVEVVSNVSYENLFSMLNRGRFNCYLRGAHEILNELEMQGNDSLMIEPNLLFVYPSTSLFFVNKDNVALATRLELGLRRAIIDGDYAKLFNENFADDIEALNFNSRRIIRLNNSLLSDEVLTKSTPTKLSIDGKIDH